MCTVTWIREADDYTLCVSRDEKLTRRTATAPSLHSADGLRFLAPLDGECGGSWVSVNERGVSVCLLNRYDPALPGLWPVRSRGKVVMGLATSSHPEDAARRLRRWDLSRFQPFTVLCLAPGRPASIVDWTGAALHGDFEAEERRPLVSSSVAQGEASRARKALFEQFRTTDLTRNALFDFHASHAPERGALSTCMHRQDAATVSFTAIDVSRNEVRMTYQQGAPCEHGPVSCHRMPRRMRRNVRAA
jgi:hypothetical protein